MYLDKVFYILFFVALLIVARLIPHPPNFSPIIASAIFAPILMKNRYYGSIVPLIALFISDVIIGFHIYQLVIYLTIVTISLISPLNKYIKINLILYSIGASIWFFIITNFAVWLAWDYYPKNFEGLMSCYILAIPFFTNTLISSVFFISLFIIFKEWIEKLNAKTNNYFTDNFFTSKN